MEWPIEELLDDDACRAWVEKRLHPNGLLCPRCGSGKRRVIRPFAAFPAYRCLECDRYYTMLSGTLFAKTHQSPRKLVLILRGFAKGEPTARLARELGLSRPWLHALRQRAQKNVLSTRPREPLPDAVVEVDELYQNAGEKRSAPSGSFGPAPKTSQPEARARNRPNRSGADLQGGGPRERRCALARQ